MASRKSAVRSTQTPAAVSAPPGASQSSGPLSSPVSGLLFGLLAFALFSSHDAIVKHLGASYSVFQILFVAG
ncbi:MAG: hypothetical protein AAFO73_10050, partial [Pseudomonadota bacterium]